MSEQRQQYESLADAAKRLGVSSRTLRRWISEGKIPAYRASQRLIRLKVEDVDAQMRRIPAVGAWDDV